MTGMYVRKREGKSLDFSSLEPEKDMTKKTACNHKLHLYFGNPFARRVRRCVIGLCNIKRVVLFCFMLSYVLDF